jgi:hypothetical protein
MAKITSLSVLLDPSGKDFLLELYGKVIENVEKSTISGLLKNKDLSGDPSSGSVEAKRFANAVSAAYGSARSGGAGVNIKAKPVSVPVNIDREIVEEIEEKDILLYGVDGLLSRRAENHQKTMIRELERAFFTAAADAATDLILVVPTQGEFLEAVIQQIETTKNDYVDGVDRDLISLVVTTGEYGKIRNYLDTAVGNANVDTATPEFGTFHGVRIYPSVYLPAEVRLLGMVHGSVAMPVLPRPYVAEKIPLSEAYAVSLFYYYGVAAVTPDLIVKVENP